MGNEENINKELPACGKTGVSTVNGQVVTINDNTCRELIREAINMLNYSYTPYSNFKVGAALLGADNKIYTGCNVENAAYTPTNCAERTAFFKAVSTGVKDFAAIAIVGGRDGKLESYCSPCGVCRQVMMEFCDPDTFYVILAKSEEDYWVYSLSEIMPMGFSPKDLK
ncbi:MAG: cytidine deaminase [Lachnospiraceae bacterium]|nr:cytidine deaminase [Lachnospiraceae bacterium]